MYACVLLSLSPTPSIIPSLVSSLNPSGRPPSLCSFLLPLFVYVCQSLPLSLTRSLTFLIFAVSPSISFLLCVRVRPSSHPLHFAHSTFHLISVYSSLTLFLFPSVHSPNNPFANPSHPLSLFPSLLARHLKSVALNGATGRESYAHIERAQYKRLKGFSARDRVPMFRHGLPVIAEIVYRSPSA